jgi:hypothetical protein
MRFTLPALSGLTLLTWHQALALPATPAEIEGAITVSANTTGHGASLGTSGADDFWTSTALHTRLEFILPVPMADTMQLRSTTIDWKLRVSYQGPSNGLGNVFVTAYSDGKERHDNSLVCINPPVYTRNTGSSNGNSWMQSQIPVEVVWLNQRSGVFISVFFVATYQLGQNDPSLTFVVSVDTAPSAWIQQGTLPTTGCPASGVGTGTTPKRWSLRPWSSIKSNVS